MIECCRMEIKEDGWWEETRKEGESCGLYGVSRGVIVGKDKRYIFCGYHRLNIVGTRARKRQYFTERVKF